MDKLAQRISKLSPQQRSLLELRLQQKTAIATEIKPRKEQGLIPLSYSQERLWVMHQLQPDIPFYNEVSAWQLEGQINAIALQKSLDYLIQRHETLRTKFVTQNGQPYQLILPVSRWELPVIDISDRPDAVKEILDKETRRPFNLAQGNLLRVKLLKVARSEHILVIVCHHIICDGWSMGKFVQELTSLYRSFVQNLAPNLPKLAIQYADFAIWQRQYLQDSTLETHLKYWEEKLKGELPVLELPTIRTRKTQVDSWRGATQSRYISAKLTQDFKTLSQQEGTTLFMTLLAAFKVLLYRYTGLTDIIVGSPIANRDRCQLEGLIGVFINTLVLRADLSGNPTFKQLLKRVQKVALEAYSHQELPFEKLVDKLQPERHLSQSPLFQVMFILQSPMTELELPGLKIDRIDIDNGTAIFDLTFNLQETNGGMKLDCEYNADLFDPETIYRLLGHWENLLKAIAANPQGRICELPLLGEEDAERNIGCNISNHKLYSPEITEFSTILDLFAARVTRNPDAVAVVCRDESLTYGELDRRSDALAHYLREIGIKTETIIGICLETSIYLPIAILSVLKAGGAYLPLDPDYPPSRLELMLQETLAPAILTQSHLIPHLPHSSATILSLDKLSPHPHSRTDVAGYVSESLLLTPPSLAYIIYTSGSTGQPKGVTINHASWVNAYLAWEEAYQLTERASSHLQMASFSFDVFAGNFARALCSGGKLVLCPKETLLEPDQLYQLMQREQVDCAEFVPSVLRHLVNYLESSDRSLDFLNLLIVGSDSWYVAENLHLKHFCGKQTRIINSYGVTEATIDSTYFESTSTDIVDRLVPIGRPFPNSEVCVLDAYLQPVPIGVTGELYIGGVGLARGYWNRPDLTAAKFIPHPDGKGDRLYRTGDLARYLPDGNLEYLGRIDNQVKIGGVRLELAEVEAAIQQHPDIAATVALVREDTPGDKRLVAYIVPHASCPIPDTRSLRQFLKDRLPDRMVPSSYVGLESLPLTPNGKLDRRSLPVPNISAPESSYTAPQNPIEAALVEIWCEVLKIEQVGTNDNFFALGGDSILAIGAIAKANQQGLHLTPKQLFQHQTISELAGAVNTTSASIQEQGLVSGKVPLNPIQSWFFAQNFAEMHHWNQSIRLELKQKLDLERLETAIARLLHHHDALRMQFSQAEQFCPPSVEMVPVARYDLSQLSPDDCDREIERLENLLQASLNLESSSLMRVAVFEMGDSRSDFLFWTIHHLVIDGISWRVLVEDLETAYANPDTALPAKTTSFKQWTEKLPEYLDSTSFKSSLNFWSRPLPQKIAPLPIDFPQGSNTVADSHSLTIELDIAETQALIHQVPAAYRTEEILLVALAQTFANWTQDGAMLLDLEGHGREDIFPNIDLSRTVGWFTTVFPVYLDLSTPIDAAIQQVKAKLRDIPNRGFDYGVWRYLSDRCQEPTIQPQIGFNYLGQFDQNIAKSTLFKSILTSSSWDCSPQGNRPYILEIDARITNGKLQAMWTYSQTLHRRENIASIAQDFIDKVRSLIQFCLSGETPSYIPSDFPLANVDLEDLEAVFAQVEFAGSGR